MICVVVPMCWQAVRTNKNTYSAQFDLMREVRVRVYTLLRGPCTNGTVVKSSNCTQLVQRPSSAGESQSKQQDLKSPLNNAHMHMQLTELSESERRSCWHRSPGPCLHVLLPRVHGVHVGKKC